VKSNCEGDLIGLNSEFQARIDSWVLNLWRQKAERFIDLLLELPGVYPSDVLGSIRRLRANELISESDASHVEGEAAISPTSVNLIAKPKKFLIEHPLDYDWRFTRIGVKRICEEINLLGLRNNSRVLCLGCPSVYLLGKNILKEFTFDLCDKNGRMIGQIEETAELLSLDFSNPVTVSSGIAAVAVVDPPWYIDFYRTFLWVAQHSISLGGRILLSFPPEGTRSTAIKDYHEVKAWCEHLGLKLQKRLTNYLPYRSPLFEVNALKAEGITNFPLDWRRGDLLVFVKDQVKSIERPMFSFSAGEWDDIYIGNSRIKIGASKTDVFDLIPVGPSEILPSVSSRNKLRGFANVVTSGNRFLQTAQPEELAECLTRIEKNRDHPERNSHRKTKRPLLLQKAIDLVYNEERETAEYYARIHEL